MKSIIATFTNGKKIRFTENVLHLLKEDKEVVRITDAETGDIIFSR